MEIPIGMTPAQHCGGEDLTTSIRSEHQGSKGSERRGPWHNGMMEIVRQCLQQKDIDSAYATWTKGIRSARKFGLDIPLEVQDFYQDLMVEEFEKKANRALINVNSSGNAIAGNMTFNPKE
jgi:hypothetical protein